ncbi:DMT family transporter [Vibrio maerlii]|uniref:DMT family transporter n=1 Tax=Vibrio maerlii TaxID=2231648 RepID=UPI000E3EBF3C|nr:DMT family transporter [Vibrio maerlii]
MSFSKNTIAWVAFAFVGMVWGSNFVFMKLASDYITPMQIVFWRVLFGFVPIAFFACAKKTLSLSHLKHGHHFLTMGLLATVVYYFGFAKGTSLLSSGIAGAISGAIPLFSIIAAALFLTEEAITKWKLIGSALGFIGILILARPFSANVDSETTLGASYMVMGAMSVGFSFVYAKRFISPLKLSSLALTTYQLGAGLIILFFVTDFEGIGAITESILPSAATIFGLGLLGTGMAYLCYYFIIENLGALTASSVTYIPPVIALAIGGLVMGEVIETRDYVATGLILLAVSVVAFAGKAKS